MGCECFSKLTLKWWYELQWVFYGVKYGCCFCYCAFNQCFEWFLNWSWDMIFNWFLKVVLCIKLGELNVEVGELACKGKKRGLKNNPLYGKQKSLFHKWNLMWKRRGIEEIFFVFWLFFAFTISTPTSEKLFKSALCSIFLNILKEWNQYVM